MRRLLCALALSLSACAPAASNLAMIPALNSAPRSVDGFDLERSTILELRADHNRAIAAGDVEGFMRIAADDYVAIFGGGRIIRSKDELRRTWMARPQHCTRTPVRLEIGLVDRQLRAAELGEWRCDVQDPAKIYKGSYFAHWSKKSGEWRVVSDTYVSLICRGNGCDGGP